MLAIYFLSNGIGYFPNRTERIAAKEPALALRKLLNFQPFYFRLISTSSFGSYWNDASSNEGGRIFFRLLEKP
jgi:hypothetical protein